MVYLIALAVGLVMVASALVIVSDRVAGPGLEGQPPRRDRRPRWQARGQVVSGQRISSRRFGLDCLVAEPGTAPIGVPVFSVVTGPVLGWPGLALVDLVADWCTDRAGTGIDDPDQIGIQLWADAAGSAQAKVTRGRSMVMLDVENVEQIRAVLHSVGLAGRRL